MKEADKIRACPGPWRRPCRLRKRRGTDLSGVFSRTSPGRPDGAWRRIHPGEAGLARSFLPMEAGRFPQSVKARHDWL